MSGSDMAPETEGWLRESLGSFRLPAREAARPHRYWMRNGVACSNSGLGRPTTE